MKKLLTALMLIISLQAISKQITIPKNADGGWYYPNGGFTAKAGDTVLMDGNYAYIKIANLIGSKSSPIVFMPKTGGTQPWVGTNNLSYSWVMQSCKYFVIQGCKIGNLITGQYNETSFNFHGSDEFEFKNNEILNCKLGLFSNLSTGFYNNIYIHDNWVHGITDALKSNFSEAIYIGPSNGTPLSATSFTALRIENNRFEDVGGDGIQLANCINVIVKNNTITNYGFHNIPGQFSGLLFGGSTSGTADNNTLTTGTGCPFNILGTGDVYLKNNIAIGCGTAQGQDGFYIRQSVPTLRVHLINNYIDKVNRNWIVDETKSIVENSGNVFGLQKPDSISQAAYDSLNTKFLNLKKDILNVVNKY